MKQSIKVRAAIVAATVPLCLAMVMSISGCALNALGDHKMYHHGIIFDSTVAINIYQGSDRSGLPIGFVRDDGKWFAVPAGFEEFYFEYGTFTGGDETLSLNMQAGAYYYFQISQIPGHVTPDIALSPASPDLPVTRPPPKSGMAWVYFFYPNWQALGIAN